MSTRQFEYQALNAEGTVVKGSASSRDEETLVTELRRQGLQIVSVQAAAEAAATPSAGKASLDLELFGVPQESIIIFTRLLATTLRAGIPLLTALTMLQAQSSSKGLRNALAAVSESIQQGKSLSVALRQHPKIFSDLYVSMVAVGEASGTLDRTVLRLANLMEHDRVVKKKIKGAMTYPLTVLAFSMLIVYGLLTGVVPQFTDIFAQSGINIARDYPLTQQLMTLSAWSSNPRMLGGAAALVVALFFGFRMLYRSEKGRLLIDRCWLNLPMFHTFVQTSLLSRFCSTLGTLVQSGVPLLEALAYLGRAMGNVAVGRMVESISTSIQSGSKLSVAISKLPFFPPLLVQMVAVGEATGTLPEMLGQITIHYEEELDAAIDRLTALLEPVMMILIGLIVCLFILGVLLPILGITNKQLEGMDARH